MWQNTLILTLCPSAGFLQANDCIGMGTFGSDRYAPGQVSKAVSGAIHCGCRMFDCAAIYGNEDLIGMVLLKTVDRDCA